MKQSVIEIFSDVDGHLSSKRLITFLAFVVLIVTWFSNLYFDFGFDDKIIDPFTYIVLGGLGTIIGEKFSNSINRFKKYEEENQ